MAEQLYEIVRFREWRTPKVDRGYGTVTLKEAQEICSDPKTSSHGKLKQGKNWFLGYAKAGHTNLTP